MIGSVTGATMLPMTAHVQRSLEQRERVVAHELERSVRDEMTMLRDVDTTHREPSQLDVLLNERAQLLETLRAASVVAPHDEAIIGTIVGLRSDAGDSMLVELTYPGDPAPEKATPASPIGRALLGRRVGDRVEIIAPSGRVGWTIFIVTPADAQPMNR